jgi:hypothetical protein
MLILKNILSIILLILSCSFIISLIPNNVSDIIPILIIASHIILFVTYALNIEHNEENKSYKRITKSKSDYIILKEINNKGEKLIKYKRNNSNKIYYMDKEDFNDNFI